MKKILLLVLLVLISVSFIEAGSYDFLKEINLYRSEYKLKPIYRSLVMCKLATTRAEQIKTDWSHDQFYTEINKINISARFYENLARNFTDPKDVMTAWKASPSHNQTLLSDIKYACVVESEYHYVFEGYKK